MGEEVAVSMMPWQPVIDGDVIPRVQLIALPSAPVRIKKLKINLNFTPLSRLLAYRPRYEDSTLLSLISFGASPVKTISPSFKMCAVVATAAATPTFCSTMRMVRPRC